MDILHQIVKEEDLYQLKYYLNTGLDSNLVDDEENTPLHICFSILKEKNSIVYDMIYTLLDYGANPMTKNKNGYVPIECCKYYDKLYNSFFESCKNGNLVHIKYLLLCRINIYSFSEKYKMSGINIAIKYKQNDILNLIQDFEKKSLNNEYISLYSNCFHCPQWVKKNYILGIEGHKMLFEDDEKKVITGIWNNNHWHELKT